MKPFTLSKAFAATVAVCLVATAALWVLNFDSIFLSHLDENLDWTTVLVPREYFLVLYLVAAGAIIGALWFRVRGRKKPLSDYILVFAVAGGLVAIALVLLLHRPPMPASWSKLRAGMTQKEVESLVGWEAVLRREKWVEQWYNVPMLGANGVWMLELTYDGPVWHSVLYGAGRVGNARLRGATATYGHQFRLLCSKPRELL